MAVLGIVWSPFSEDIHLASGFVSSRLVQVLVIAAEAFGSKVKWGDDPAVHNAGIQVTFSSMPAAVGTGNSKITVHPTTGEVKVPDPLPPLLPGENWPQTMVVTAKVGGFNRQMRIVIHRALEKIWLAPNLGPGDGLTVRVSAVVPGKGPRASTRFSVMGKFTDGEIADLNNWSPGGSLTVARDRRFVRHLRPNGEPEDDPALAWSSTGTGITIDPASGFMVCANKNALVTVKAEIKPIGSGPTATALASGAPAWSTPVKVEPINRGTSPNMDQGRNFLILPDGFDSTQEQELRDLAADIVGRLDRNILTSPYQHLKHKFNYFLAWVPSPVSMTSVLNELDRSNSKGYEYDMAHRPPIADRCLVNERNTAFHCAFGHRPTATSAGGTGIELNPLRLEPDDFEDFLKALTDPNGNPVGSVWAQGGKDEMQVGILCRYFHEGGSNNARGTGRYVAQPLRQNKEHRLQTNPYGKGFDVEVQQGFGSQNDAEAIKLLSYLNLAHEFAHSFGLKDEYAYSSDTGAISSGQYLEVDSAPNVQRRATLLDPVTGILDPNKIKYRWPRIFSAGILTAKPTATFGTFTCTVKAAKLSAVGTIVRLRPPPLSDPQDVKDVTGDNVTIAPRAGSEPVAPGAYPTGSFLILGSQTFGALRAPPQPTFVVGRFVCQLNAHQGIFFKNGQVVVRLRTRDIFMPPTVSGPLTVTACRYLLNPNSEIEVELSPLQGSTPPDPNNYPPGSTLIEPTLGAALSMTPRELGLVHDSVLQQMNSTQNPLNASASDLQGRPCPGGVPDTKPTPATNFPAGKTPNPPADSSLIVGLYESAFHTLCDAFRPTGICLMRDVNDSHPLCPVCRYAIVDFVDPTMHGEIDREYKQDYPPP